jgi:hypothetical protein
MPVDDSLECTIRIEYDDFLTRFDIDEVLGSIDRIIEVEFFLPYLDFPPFRYPYLALDASEFSYVGIKSFDSGSLLLTVFISGSVATYVATRFKRGVNKSLLADQIERSGRLTGDFLARALSKVNDWAEQYVPKQKELGGKITKISVQRNAKHSK